MPPLLGLCDVLVSDVVGEFEVVGAVELVVPPVPTTCRF